MATVSSLKLNYNIIFYTEKSWGKEKEHLLKLCSTHHTCFTSVKKKSRFHFLSHFLSRLCAAQMGITAAPPSTGVMSRAPPASEAIQWCPGSQSFLLLFTWTPASRWRSKTSRVTSGAAAKTTRPAAEHHPPLGAAAPLHKYKKICVVFIQEFQSPALELASSLHGVLIRSICSVWV